MYIYKVLFRSSFDLGLWTDQYQIAANRLRAELDRGYRIRKRVAGNKCF